MAELTDIRETVRERYAAAARGAGCCGTTDASGAEVFGATLYGAESEGASRDAVAASLGCGVPTAVADLHEGETVLDLGSGAGADVLISARRVGASGRAIGLDMTDEMLDLARVNAAEAGAENVEFVRGHIEDIPLADASVDVVISNSGSSSHWHSGSPWRRRTSRTWTRTGSDSAFATAAIRSASRPASSPVEGAQQSSATGPGVLIST